MIGLPPVRMTLPGYDPSIGGSGMSSHSISLHNFHRKAKLNVILDPSHFIGAINVHDLSVGGQFNIQIKPQWYHPLTSFDESGIALWFR